MTERPSLRDIELDGIDDAHKRAIGAAYAELSSYAKGPGEGAKTADDAEKLARSMLHNARKYRETAIALVNDELN